jgi:phosphate-selective porin OprO/OprP
MKQSQQPPLVHVGLELQAENQPGGLPPPTPSTDAQATEAAPGAQDSTPSGQGSSQDSKSKDSDGKSEKTILAGWDNGFILRSKDKDFSLRITGQIQADYRAFLDGEDAVDIDSFFIRRARLGIEANMFKYYEFRFLPDFGLGKTVLEDAYLNIHYWDQFEFEVGKFKQPFSYEQLIQDRFVPTLERSIIDQLVPQRDEGVMVHGYKLFEDRFDYGVAVSNGEINGDMDTNEHKDFNGRVVLRPLNSPEFWPIFHLLQPGLSGGVGVEQEPVMPSTLKTPAGVPWFKYDATVVADGVRWRISPELSYFYRGLGFAWQYYRQEEELRPSAIPPGYKFRRDVPTEGYYFLLTYLLTGEQRTTYSEPIKPLRPFSPYHPLSCAGAWELVWRISRLEVGDNVFAPGPANLANPATNSRAATELTAGFNWYLNEWVRMQVNYEHAWFQDPVLLGTNPKTNLTLDSDAFMLRWQIIF